MKTVAPTRLNGVIPSQGTTVNAPLDLLAAMNGLAHRFDATKSEMFTSAALCLLSLRKQDIEGWVTIARRFRHGRLSLDQAIHHPSREAQASGPDPSRARQEAEVAA